MELQQEYNKFKFVFIILLAVMDPRPYHFEYRRPRLYNPTFQSSHLYDSIYQLRSNNNQRNPEQRNNKSISLTDNQLKRANSTDLGSNKALVELENIGTYRYNSKGNLEQPNKVNQSKMANYGTNLIRNTSMDQTQVYKKQEKEFNIISFYPKEYKPNLRQYPRLTLEDKLIEQKES